MLKSIRRQSFLGIVPTLLVLTLACSTPARHDGASSTASTAPGSFHGSDVEFASQMGDEISYFVRKAAPGERDGKVMASQLRLRSGSQPGITTSWPAGNSGIFFVLKPAHGTARINAEAPPAPVAETSGQRGIEAAISASVSASPQVKGASDKEVQDFELTSVVEGSMRSIREARDYKVAQPEFTPTSRWVDGAILAERESIDHLTHYRLILRPIHGTKATEAADGKSWQLTSLPGKPVEFDLKATTDEAPLTPVPIEEIVTPEALKRADPHDMAEFAYLIYGESILAGADNYLTMFGRDNEYLLTIGAEGLLPKAYEIVFASHLDAMGEDGNLAHEPAIGEFASVLSQEAGKGPKRIPSYDYKMVDTRFLLAPSVVRYLEKASPERAREFFARKTSKGLSYKQALAKNLGLVLSSAKMFARNPVWKNLISLLPGRVNGNWRDSGNGLGKGRYPFDVNVALLPGALSAIVEIDRKLPDPAFDALATKAKALYPAWAQDSWKLFDVSLSRQQAQRDIKTYGKELGLGKGLIQIGLSHAVTKFEGISLDARGKPVPILNTDGGFVLLYGDRVPEDRILNVLRTVTEPFLGGLYSSDGIFISNAAHAPEKIRKEWNFNPYHGLVIWPWQEFMIVEGIARQLERGDLTPGTTRALKDAELKLWGMLYKTSAYLGIELYTVKPRGDTLVPVPFGQSARDETTSTIIQAWSKLGLLIHPPLRVTAKLGEMPRGTEADRHFDLNGS